MPEINHKWHVVPGTARTPRTVVRAGQVAGVRAHFSDIIPNATIGKQSPVNNKLGIARGLLRGRAARKDMPISRYQNMIE